MATSVKGAKAALQTLFVALHAADPDPVQVIYGPATADNFRQADRVVQIGGAKGTAEADALDLGTYTERYVIEIVTSVDLAMVADSAGQQTATEAVLDLWSRQELAVREHPTGDLGASASGVLGARVNGEPELMEPPTGTGRSAAVRWGVYVIGQRT